MGVSAVPPTECAFRCDGKEVLPRQQRISFFGITVSLSDVTFPSLSFPLTTVVLVSPLLLIACGGRSVEDVVSGSGGGAVGGATLGTGGGDLHGTGGRLSGVGGRATGGALTGGPGGGSPITGGTGGEGGSASASGGQGGEAICELPLESGPCEAAFGRFGYDPEAGACVEFIYGGCGGNANNFESLEECRRVCGDGRGVARDACEIPADCAPVPSGCCGPCEASLQDFEALNVSFVPEYLMEWEQRCAGVDCAICPVEAQNFGVTCEANRCVVYDVRLRDDLSACQVDADCRLRAGLSCCESCEEDAWVAVSERDASVFDVSCGAAHPCPPCSPQPPDVEAGCIDGTCRVLSLTR